jgi:hypothetical protein
MSLPTSSSLGEQGGADVSSASKCARKYSWSYALFQEPANLFAKRAIRDHGFKRWPVGPPKWPILISGLNTAVASVLGVAKRRLRSALCRDSFVDALKFQGPLLHYEDGILKIS